MRDILPRYLAGGTWKVHIINRKGKQSQTSGLQKSETCKTDKNKNFFAKRSRSYKYLGYNDWCKKMSSYNM